MAKLIWAVTCRRLIQDVQTGLFSYIDTLDALASNKFPAAAPGLFVGTLWERAPGEPSIAVRVRVYGSTGEHLMDVPADVLTFEPHHKKARINIGFGGFPITSPGLIHFGIEVKNKRTWTEAFRLPLEIELATEPNGNPQD